ncbi:cytidylate kinase family protein [Treponema sp.]|uniref:cytidylate kinase family protein n=1 Tax=Treponema sp. TaxID=166 RepID=UPI00298E2021|nr:cytidylate kinase family protein [Treponema sp.]MCR5613459.1 cytidylate kinase family protein [Treponema sp.]
MRSKKELIKRYTMFFFGIFSNALGVAFITRSMLGTGPTTCIPYVLSLSFPFSFGTFTFLFNLLLLLVQLLLLQKKFPRYQFFQIPANLLFSVCIDFAMNLTKNLAINNYGMAIIFTVLGCSLRALGVSLSVVADVVMLSAEAFVKAISDFSKKEFSICKLVSDATMSAIAVGLSFLFLGKLEAVREGTLITVIIVGPLSKYFSDKMGFAHHYFSVDGEFVYEEKLKLKEGKRLVLTITSLAGSGGRIIARLLGERLSIPVYDKELIDIVAEQGHLSKLFVKQHDEKLYTNIAEAFILEHYSFHTPDFESYRSLFKAQTAAIKNLAQTQDCIIIGHCSNHILKDSPEVLNIFITANQEHRLEYIQHKYKIDKRLAARKIKKQDSDTEKYYRHFTDSNWKDSDNYHLTIDSSLLGYEGTVNLLEQLVRQHYLDVNKVKIRATADSYKVRQPAP